MGHATSLWAYNERSIGQLSMTCAYHNNHSTITTSIQSILEKSTWTQFVVAINKISYNLVWTNNVPYSYLRIL